MSEWVRGAIPGSHYVYHEGYLPRDRGALHVRGAARLALEMSDKGILDLSQNRLGNHLYVYRATKRAAVRV